MALTNHIIELEKLERKLEGFIMKVIKAIKNGQDLDALEREYEETKNRIRHLRRKHRESIMYIPLSPGMSSVIPISRYNGSPLVTLKTIH